MIHDSDLLDQLSGLEIEKFAGEVFRATRKSLEPLAPSTNGGRWMPKGESSVLYTSLSRDGALAELTYHWGMLSPLPSKPAILSHIKVDLSSSLHILRSTFKVLGIKESEYAEMGYHRMQMIGAAAAFLGIHGLIVPSARWSCENLVIFTENLPHLDSIEVIDNQEVDWKYWGKENSFLD